MGALRWAALAHQPEPGALLAPGDDVRRRRQSELRSAEPAGPSLHAHGLRAHPWRKGWRAGTHTLHLGDPDPRALGHGRKRCWYRAAPDGQLSGPGVEKAIRTGRQQPRSAESGLARKRRWLAGPPEHA